MIGIHDESALIGALIMQPFVSDLEVQNYRALKQCAISDLRWVNVIGGLNGAGKSTLLEALFTFMDALGPFPFLRPLMLRSLPGDYGLAKSIVFGPDQDTFSIGVRSKSGTYKAEFKWEAQFFAPTITTPEAFQRSPADTGYPGDGVTGTLTLNDKILMKRHYSGDARGLMLKDDVDVSHKLSNASYLSRLTISASEDIARRFSLVAQSGRKKELLNIAQNLSPSIEGLELLQFGAKTVLHADIGNGRVVPVEFLGDGTLNLISMSLAIMECPGGVVLLDEFDASIHYSRLDFVWGVIKQLALTYNCQIFAATHSREAIESSSRVFSDKSKDYCYIRLACKNGATKATRYNQVDVTNAAVDGWEIR